MAVDRIRPTRSTATIMGKPPPLSLNKSIHHNALQQIEERSSFIVYRPMNFKFSAVAYERFQPLSITVDVAGWLRIKSLLPIKSNCYRINGSHGLWCCNFLWCFSSEFWNVNHLNHISTALHRMRKRRLRGVHVDHPADETWFSWRERCINRYCGSF